jgi:hypothetical protein
MAKRVAGWRGLTALSVRAQIECGMHSGIPDCCILFFVGRWVWMTDRATATYWRRITKVAREGGRKGSGGGGGVGYIPCPRCLDRRTFVPELRACWCGA